MEDAAPAFRDALREQAAAAKAELAERRRAERAAARAEPDGDSPLEALEREHRATLRDFAAQARPANLALGDALRAAVEAAVADGVSLSQIALRCGHVKSRRTRPRVGDTSWLGRRIGLLPETGQEEPSPWIHADVLAVIARDGLGLDPRQVEPA
jgi:hypothetical protein